MTSDETFVLTAVPGVVLALCLRKRGGVTNVYKRGHKKHVFYACRHK